MKARKLTEQFYEALKNSGSHSPIQAQVQEVVTHGMQNVIRDAAEKAFSTHKLKHIEECNCKRCREAEKIKEAVLKLLEEV